MTAHNIEGMMRFEEVSNGWKCIVNCYPFRAHYIKLLGVHESKWMLEYVEMLREDMQDRIDASFKQFKLEQAFGVTW